MVSKGHEHSYETQCNSVFHQGGKLIAILLTTSTDRPICQAARRRAIASAHARLSKRTARKKVRIQSTQVDNV